MRPLTILVDMDDTIESLTPAWLSYLNERYGKSVSEKEVENWDMRLAFPDISEECVYGALKDEALWDRVKPIPGAVKYLKRLIDDGNYVYILTASHPDTLSVKVNRVLFKYFPYLNAEQIIVAGNKQMIQGDILVDDGFHNMGGKYMGLLFTAQHNRNISDDELAEKNAVRVDNWKEAYSLIHGYQVNNRK